MADYLGAAIMPICIKEKDYRLPTDACIYVRSAFGPISDDKVALQMRKQRFLKIFNMGKEIDNILYKFNKDHIVKYLKSYENACILNYFLALS